MKCFNFLFHSKYRKQYEWVGLILNCSPNSFVMKLALWSLMFKMEIFELLRKHFALCGVSYPQKPPNKHPLNVKNSSVLVILYIFVALIAISLNEAESFDELTDTVFRSVSISVCGIFYVIIVWKTSKLFEFIDNLDETVKTSEFRSFDLIWKPKNKYCSLCECRSNIFRAVSIVHRNESKIGKEVGWSGLCIFQSHTFNHVASNDRQLLHILCDTFWKISFQVTFPHVVINFVWSFDQSIHKISFTFSQVPIRYEKYCRISDCHLSDTCIRYRHAGCCEKLCDIHIRNMCHDVSIDRRYEVPFGGYQ